MSDRLTEFVRYWRERTDALQTADRYFYNLTIEELLSDVRVRVRGREMLMFASYGYLGLLGHPQIKQAALAAIEKYGTGTHGVRVLAGTLPVHEELEETIARFKGTEAAVTFSSGYATNLTAISTLLGRHDTVICDKFNHASIVDGCLLSGAKFLRFKHNDMIDLEQTLRSVDTKGITLVVVDGVFSMDGDVIDLPRVVELCRQHNAYLMVDEAHSVGVLGRTGRGIEEHFGLGDAIDLKMGTLSKTIPSVGGYLAGREELIHIFKHASRAYVFSAALPPAQAAAAKAAFDVILAEPERVTALNRNKEHWLTGLKQLGFDTLQSTTAIVPVICGPDELAYDLVRECQHRNVFVLPVISPAVPQGSARLRSTVTAVHQPAEIDQALDALSAAGKAVGLI
jgi:glycine C-acetyltransferase